ncbi:MAG TPA: type II secretion system secretin GspD [Candidatus Binatia bacterium]|nr:type II secretion system secretin GspD [Candidatus Binatia bacterium]
MKHFLTGLVLLALALPAGAATTLNLKDADINTLIATVSEVTGKNFIVDDRVKGKVTVISSRPMSAEGVYETFLAVLAVKGFAAVPVGEVIKIIQVNDARSDGGARIANGSGLAEDEIVTYVFDIQNVSASQLAVILRPLMSQWGHLAAYGPSNMLIVADRASNVVKLQKLIAQIDQAGDRDIELIKLQNASAGEMVRILTTLTQQDKNTDPTVKPAVLLADERTNSIMVGGDKAERQKILGIIQQLDVPLAEDGATQVVYLRYASAENLAPILEGYAQQADQANPRPGGAGGAAAPASASGGGGGGSIVGAEGRSRIIADKDTNALVITASPKTMRAVKTVIAQLDIKRAQVLVEAVIAEVSASKSAQLGVDWAVFNRNSIAAAGILDPSTLTIVKGIAAGSTAGLATAASAIGTGLTMVGGADNRPGGTSVAAIIKALQGDGESNLLSTPSVVATDNEESQISVGKEVPFLTGSYSNTTSGTTTGFVNPFQTIQRKDVGLTLGLTPQISGEGDSIKLKIKLEVSSLDSASASPVDLITNKRTLTTVVTVENGQILVLGGLIDKKATDAESGIPFLSSIPLLGQLFQFRKRTNDKSNLMVFIRPAILRRDAEVDYYTRRKYDSVRQSQIDQLQRAKPTLLPTFGSSVLPQYDDYERDTLKVSSPPAPAGGGATVPLRDSSPPVPPGAAPQEGFAPPVTIPPAEPAPAPSKDVEPAPANPR